MNAMGDTYEFAQSRLPAGPVRQRSGLAEELPAIAK